MGVSDGYPTSRSWWSIITGATWSCSPSSWARPATRWSWRMTPEEFGLALDRSDEIGLALIDLAGLGRRIWDPCERLRAKGIPLLVISPRQSVAIERESLAHGARSVLIKPLVVKELLALIRGLLEDETLEGVVSLSHLAFYGHGLDLPAVLGIMRSHGDGLSLNSQEGKGSTVTALWPLAAPLPSPQAGTYLPGANRSARRTCPRDLARDLAGGAPQNRIGGGR